MTMHHAGDIWKLTNFNKNWWSKHLLCKGCDGEFKEGQWVIQATTTHRRERYNLNNKYARIRHIECFVDAKGNPLKTVPNGNHK